MLSLWMFLLFSLAYTFVVTFFTLTSSSIPLMIHLPTMMTSDGPLSTLSNFHCMQPRLPHHFERDMVDDTLAHNDAREVNDIPIVAGRPHSSLLCQ